MPTAAHVTRTTRPVFCQVGIGRAPADRDRVGVTQTPYRRLGDPLTSYVGGESVRDPSKSRPAVAARTSETDFEGETELYRDSDR